MASYSRATAPTKFVEVEGALIAYCSFGTEKRTPLLLLNHYRAGMDHWDPLVPEFMAHRQSIALPPKAFTRRCLLKPPRCVNDPPLRPRGRTAGRPYIPRTRRDDPSMPEKKRRNDS